MSKKTYPYFYDPSKKESTDAYWTSGNGVPALSWAGEDQSAGGAQKTAKESKTPMEKILGGPVPGGAQTAALSVPTTYAQTNNHNFSRLPGSENKAALERINQSISPVLNQNRVPAGAGLPGYAPPSSGGVRLNDAALYDQYRDLYERQGRLAKEDAAGKAAAMTGGQASSYGQTAGEQSYDAYLAEYDSLLRKIQGSSSEDTGDWYDDLLGGENDNTFTGTTRQEAEAFLASRDIPAEALSDLLPQAQWIMQKRGNKKGGAETEFDTYAEYLSAFVEYVLDTYGS